MNSGGQGCLIGALIAIGVVLAIIALIIYIIVMVAFFALIATAIISIIMILLGAIYGTYRGILCYAVAVYRTYGHQPDYEAGKGMKALVICSTLFLFIAIFFIYMHLNGVNIFNYNDIIDFIAGLYIRLEESVRMLLG